MASRQPPPAPAHLARIDDQERRRLLRDLHDEVGHDLVLIKLHLENIARYRSSPSGSRLAEAIALVSHAIDALRRLTRDLGPAVLENPGFLPAIRGYIRQFSSRVKIKVSFRTRNLPAEIPSAYQLAVYHVLQSALSNVVEHASAQHVTVSLGRAKPSALRMVIADNGVGFNVSAKLAAGSFGLTAMQERVEALGGEIRFRSRPQAAGAKTYGTKIEVTLPLRSTKSGSRSR